MIFSYEVPVKNVLNVGITVVRPNKDCARKLLILADLDNILNASPLNLHTTSFLRN